MFVQEDLRSPIDMYLVRVKDLLNYGTPVRLKETDFLGRLLMLNVVSAAEAYFRSIMSAAIETCPLAQSSASEKTINLGGLLWHGRDGFSRSAFDNVSFASGDELKKTSEQYIGFKLDASVFQSSLQEYDKVCQFRHGIVHGDGLLPGKNAIKLEIPRSGRPVRIVVEYRHLQDVAAVVTTLVALYNRGLFDLMCRRWAIDWRKRTDWDIENEKSMFQKVWKAFASTEELARKSRQSGMRKVDCMRAVKAQFNL